MFVVKYGRETDVKTLPVDLNATLNDLQRQCATLWSLAPGCRVLGLPLTLKADHPLSTVSARLKQPVHTLTVVGTPVSIQSSVQQQEKEWADKADERHAAEERALEARHIRQVQTEELERARQECKTSNAQRSVGAKRYHREAIGDWLEEVLRDEQEQLCELETLVEVHRVDVRYRYNDLVCRLAVEYDKLKSLKYLISQGAVPSGRTICIAAQYARMNMLTFLIDERQVDLKTIVPDPLEGACGAGHVDVVEWLRGRGLMFTSRCVASAIDGQHLPILRLIIQSPQAVLWADPTNTAPALGLPPLTIGPTLFLRVMEQPDPAAVGRRRYRRMLDWLWKTQTSALTPAHWSYVLDTCCRNAASPYKMQRLLSSGVVQVEARHLFLAAIDRRHSVYPHLYTTMISPSDQVDTLEWLLRYSSIEFFTEPSEPHSHASASTEAASSPPSPPPSSPVDVDATTVAVRPPRTRRTKVQVAVSLLAGADRNLVVEALVRRETSERFAARIVSILHVRLRFPRVLAELIAGYAVGIEGRDVEKVSKQRIAFLEWCEVPANASSGEVERRLALGTTT